MVEQYGGGQNFGEQKVRDNRDKRELDAQRQYVVIGTLALLFTLMLYNFDVSRAAAPKRAMPLKSCYTQLMAQKTWSEILVA